MIPKMKVLLVDDTDFFLEMERSFLRHIPATILTASNGAEALDVAVEHRPDLVYMDVQMPVMDGLSCLKIFKSNPALKSIPVIMVFTPAGDITKGKLEAAGCDGVITKPIDRQVFLEVGHKFLFDIDRRDKRIPCQIKVDFSAHGKKYQGVGIDLSDGGIFLQSREDLPEKGNVRLSFQLQTPNSERIEVDGLITWVNQGFPRPHLGMPRGIGVQFRNLGSYDRSIIREYVSKHR